jgi:hypothetical protein
MKIFLPQWHFLYRSKALDDSYLRAYDGLE